MATRQIAFKVPEELYKEMLWAKDEYSFPSLADFVRQVIQQRLAEMRREAWRKKFRELQRQVREAEGFGLGESKEEIISNLRAQRQRIFEAEYAHLYR